jgi:hypothetical protein
VAVNQVAEEVAVEQEAVEVVLRVLTPLSLAKK